MLLQVASFLLTHEIILGIDISEVRHCCVLRQISFFLSIPDFAHHVLLQTSGQIICVAVVEALFDVDILKKLQVPVLIVTTL